MNPCFLSLSCLWNFHPSPDYDQSPGNNLDHGFLMGIPEKPCWTRVAACSAFSLLEEGCTQRGLHGREGGPSGTLFENCPVTPLAVLFCYCSSCGSLLYVSLSWTFSRDEGCHNSTMSPVGLSSTPLNIWVVSGAPLTLPNIPSSERKLYSENLSKNSSSKSSRD